MAGSASGRPALRPWFRSAWRFPRRDEYLRMLEEYRDELQEELSEVNRMKTVKEEKD